MKDSITANNLALNYLLFESYNTDIIHNLISIVTTKIIATIITKFRKHFIKILVLIAHFCTLKKR